MNITCGYMWMSCSHKMQARRFYTEDTRWRHWRQKKLVLFPSGSELKIEIYSNHILRFFWQRLKVHQKFNKVFNVNHTWASDMTITGSSRSIEIRYKWNVKVKNEIWWKINVIITKIQSWYHFLQILSLLSPVQARPSTSKTTSSMAYNENKLTINHIAQKIVCSFDLCEQTRFQ